jgi:hypothetical protein
MKAKRNESEIPELRETRGAVQHWTRQKQQNKGGKNVKDSELGSMFRLVLLLLDAELLLSLHNGHIRTVFR